VSLYNALGFLDHQTITEPGKPRARKKIMPAPKCRNGRGVTAEQVTEDKKGVKRHDAE
jgi:hypothetical protein